MSESVENIAREAEEPFAYAYEYLSISDTWKPGLSFEKPHPPPGGAIRNVQPLFRRALEGARVRVKPLEWRSARNGRDEARTRFGCYVAYSDGNWAADFSEPGTASGPVPLDAAKAAAQADFARRVRACLEGEA